MLARSLPNPPSWNRNTIAIESYAPEWTKKVNFATTDGVWDLNQVRAAGMSDRFPFWSSLAESISTPAQSSPTTDAASSSTTSVGPEDTQTSSTPVPASPSRHRSSNIAPIVGGVVGGLVFIFIGASVLFICLKRKANRQVIHPSQPTTHIRPRSKNLPTKPETGSIRSNGAIRGQVSVATDVPTSSVAFG